MCPSLHAPLDPPRWAAPRSGSRPARPRGLRVFQARRLPGVLAIVLASPIAWAGDCTPPTAPPRLGDAVGLEYEDDLPDVVVDAAIEHWRACPGYGTDFPAFLVDGEGLRRIRIRRARPSDVSSECGTFRGDAIVLHDEALDRKGRPADCGSLAQNMAHELGHVLGLGHLESRARCRTHIMGVVTPAEAFGRKVSAEECVAAGVRWLTAPEIDEARRLGYFDGVAFSMPLGEVDRLLNGRE